VRVLAGRKQLPARATGYGGRQASPSALSSPSAPIVTIALEYWATQIGARWEYAEQMPRLPLLGTGLAPLLQWLLIPPLVAWLVRRQIP
jgi:hypothetical protein